MADGGQNFDNPKLKNPVSRRNFLKLGAYGLGAAASEIAFGPFRNISQGLHDLTDQLGEGNLVQRTAILDRLVSHIIRHPTNETNRQLLVSWIKFNAAEEYGKQLGYPLLVHNIRHFLYGNGQKVALLPFFRYSVNTLWRQSVTPQLIPVNASEDEVVARYLQGRLNRTLYLEGNSKPVDFSFQTSTTSASLSSTIKQNGGAPFNVRAVVLNEDGVYAKDEMYLTLGRYTVTVNGTATAISSHPNHNEPYRPNITEVLVTKPTITLYDRYDWDTTGFEEKDLGSFARIVFANLHIDTSQYPAIQNVMALLSERKVRIDQNDGRLLVAHGYGHEFDLKCAFKLQSPLNLVFEEGSF